MSSWLPTPSTARHLFYGVLIGFALSLGASTATQSYQRRKRERSEAAESSLRPIELRSDEILDGVSGLIGELVFVRTTQVSSSHSQVTRRLYASTP